MASNFCGVCAFISKLFYFQMAFYSLDTILIQIYMDAPPGVPGVSKNQIFFLYK